MQRSLISAAVSGLFAAQPGEAQSGGQQKQGGAAAKPPKFCDKSWDEQGVCTYKFGNGTVLTFDTNKVNDETKLDLRCHGANQKVGDSFAGVKGDYGQGIKNAQATIDQLLANEWTADREGGAPRLAELAEAIARIKGVELEKARTAVEKASDEQRKTWRSNAGVKSTIAKLRLEKAEAAEAAQTEQEEIEVELE